jgi:hypothetical protein
MQNIAPSRALARRARYLLQVGIIIAVIGTFLAALGLVLFVIQLVPGPNIPGWYQAIRGALLLAGAAFGVAGIGVAVRAVTRKTENDLALLTGDFLGQYLDERYTFIRNINPPGAPYIDGVLVGPPGLLVFRILDDEGIFANERANWLEQKKDGSWFPARIRPTREVVDDIQLVRDYLTKHNLGDAPVFGVVVFTKEAPTVSVAVKEPVVPVSLLHSLLDNLKDNYLSKERIPQEMVTALTRLMLEQ